MLFAITNIDKPNTAALRASLREAHLAYLDGLLSQLVPAGPVPSSEGKSAGNRLFEEAADQATADAFAAADPSALGRPFQSVTIKPYRLVFKDGARVA
jgi:uncharacterized protein YciI